MTGEEETQGEQQQESSMTASARAKLQGLWTSLRSIKLDEGVESRVASLTSKWNPASSSASSEQVSPTSTLENMMRTMFASCSNNAADNTALSSDDVEPHLVADASSEEKGTSSSSNGSKEAHNRAKNVVQSLRETIEQRESSPSHRKSTVVPKPFHMSSPAKRNNSKEAPVQYLVKEISPNCPILNSASFDDGISAISAHTLEEQERQNQLTKVKQIHAVRSKLMQQEGFEAVKPAESSESSLFPPSSPPRSSSAEDDQEERDCIGISMSPFDVQRGRSNLTWGNRTIQTRSTQSTDFEEQWLQDEQMYWEKIAVEDDLQGDSPATIRKGSVRHLQLLMKARDLEDQIRGSETDSFSPALKRDLTNTTLTTAGSSALSTGTSSPFNLKHPHETMPLSSRDFCSRISRDPDRIQDMIAVDADTEIGEI